MCRSGQTALTLLPDTVFIESGPLSARLSPAWGGRMTHLAHVGIGDILVAMRDKSFEPLNWPRAGAYPLFPFHNRIYGASFVHGGVKYDLLPHPALGHDAIHGPAHRRPWRVSSQSANHAVLTLDYQPDAEWPFAFRAEQAFSLDATGLTVELKLTNLADMPAPGGIGWHPYFLAGLDCEAQTDATLEYPLDVLNVPNGQPPTARTSTAISASTGYTLHFTDWSNAHIRRPDGLSLILEADPVLSHLAVHRMERYLCLEPVSMAAGVLGAPEEDRIGLGLRTLAPGETLSGHIRLRIEPGAV